MRKIIIIMSLLFCASQASSQTPLYKNFTTDDGLPTNEVYDVIQDDLGYIWFATDMGVARFDGSSFKIFTKNDGLTSNVILYIYKGRNHKIWFSSYTEGASYYKNGKIYPAPFNDSLSKITTRFINQFYETEDNTLYFTTSSDKIIYSYKNGNLNIEHPNDRYKGNTNLKYVRFIKKIGAAIFMQKLILTHNNPNNSNYFFEYKSYPHIKINDYNGYTFLNISFTVSLNKAIEVRDKSVLVAVNNVRWYLDNQPKTYLLKIKDTKVERIDLNITNNIATVFEDKDGNIILGTNGGGIYFFKDGNLTAQPLHLLTGEDVGNIMQDREGNYWITTTQNGIYQIPSFNIYQITNLPHNNIHDLTKTDKELIIVTKSGQYLSYNGTKLNTLSIKVDHPGFSYSTKNGWILYNNNNKTSIYDLANTNKIIATYNGGIIDLFEVDRGYYTIGNNTLDRHNSFDDILKFRNKDSKKISSFYDLIAYRVEDSSRMLPFKCLYIDHKQKKWIGTLNKLLLTNGDSIDAYYPNPINKRTNHIIGIGGKYMVIATKEDGLVLRKNNTNIEITQKDGLLSDIINCIYAVDNDLYVATSNGLNILHFNSDFSTFTIDVLEMFSPRIIGSVKKIIKFKENIYLGSNKGLYSFNPDEISQLLSNIPIAITDIKVNNESVITDSVSANYSAEYKNFEFSFNGFSYSAPTQVNYKYILKGYSDDTIHTKNTSLQFTNLSAGEYSFVVWASTNNTNWSDVPAIYTFTILPHYTETWWFILLMVLAGLLIVSSVFLLIIRNLKRRNEIQKELLLLEQKALRAQMNPHFTFNALNSIQYFITDNNKRAATTFLSKFSKLVRNILNNSRSNTISLADEISTLTTYLELEQMRFNGKIAIGIHIGDDLITDDIFIPSMIIQPFVENAIWHGIMPKEDGMGKLELSFELKSNTLVCIVKDNGIGRKKSAELKEKTRKGHKSAGLKNIEDRIAVLNHINPKNKIYINITDINNEGVTGTEVIIIFELGKEYND